MAGRNNNLIIKDVKDDLLFYKLLIYEKFYKNFEIFMNNFRIIKNKNNE